MNSTYLNPIWLIIFSGLIGAILSSFLSSYLYRRHEKRKQKLDTFRRLLGNRWAITEGQESNFEHFRGEFIVALNEIFVVFHDSNSVRDALKKYNESKSLDNLISLFKAICKDLKISYEFNDSIFSEPFTPSSRFT